MHLVERRADQLISQLVRMRFWRETRWSFRYGQEISPGDCQIRSDDRVAPKRIPSVLALEESPFTEKAVGVAGNHRTDSQDEPSDSPLGRNIALEVSGMREMHSQFRAAAQVLFAQNARSPPLLCDY